MHLNCRKAPWCFLAMEKKRLVKFLQPLTLVSCSYHRMH
jgi:hypothetical protein